MESLREFFYAVVDALLTKMFPKSCLMVNTIVELRTENEEVIEKYDEYLESLRTSYRVVLVKAHALGQYKHLDRIDQYAEFLLGIIFSLSILYKIYDEAELHQFIDEQLAFIQ